LVRFAQQSVVKVHGIIVSMNFRIARFFIQISRPIYLLCNVLFFALGVGIARYLGEPLDMGDYFLGQFWALTLQLGGHYLAAFFLLTVNPRQPDRILLPQGENGSNESIRKDIILWAAYAALAATTSITLLMIRANVSVAALIVMGLISLGAIFYALPPLQIARTGYGELTLALLMANLIPALAFLLQAGGLHQMVALSTFPLTMLHLAMLLAAQFPDYLQDVKGQKYTLLVRLGWQRGMILHNLLVLSAFVFIGAAVLIGLPSPVGLPAFLVFPLGLFQVWYMTRIAAGARPFWRLLNFNAVFTFGLTAYLLTFGFWMR
jgi:1,4-dihydroxy-2-naphthoate octaprenyltransferase